MTLWRDDKLSSCKFVKRVEFGEFRTNDSMRKHIKDCLDNNWVTMGPKVEEFERKFADRFSYQYAVMMSSGTSADMAALMTLYDYGASPGDEVIVPALSFIATSNAVRAAGFKPVWVDIKRETLNIDDTKIESVISMRTRAILSVNTMGKPCKMDVLRDLADKHRLKLISDSCESHFCKYKGKYINQYADMCTYSGYIAHVLMSAEAGVVGTNSEKNYQLLKSIRSHGRPVNSNYFDHQRYGLNFKPTDLHAAIGLGSFDDLEVTFGKRVGNFKHIMSKVGDKIRKFCWLSEQDEGDFNCPHGISFVVKNPANFELLTNLLDEYNIHYKKNFGCIPTQHGAFKRPYYDSHYAYDTEFNKLSYTESEYVGNYGVHIGCHPYLTLNDIDQIIDCLSKFCTKARL